MTPCGMRPNSKQVEAVKQFPRPTDVAGFLGLSSYYRRFIKNSSQIAEHLRELTRKNATFQWTAACDDAMT